MSTEVNDGQAAAPLEQYAVEVRKLSDAEGGGYLATIPELGARTFVADGATPAEAIEALQVLGRELAPLLAANGVELPPPAIGRARRDASGNLMLRIPRQLHRQLLDAAHRDGVSLNKYVTYILASGLSGSGSARDEARHSRE